MPLHAAKTSTQAPIIPLLQTAKGNMGLYIKNNKENKGGPRLLKAEHDSSDKGKVRACHSVATQAERQMKRASAGRTKTCR